MRKKKKGNNRESGDTLGPLPMGKSTPVSAPATEMTPSRVAPTLQTMLADEGEKVPPPTETEDKPDLHNGPSDYAEGSHNSENAIAAIPSLPDSGAKPFYRMPEYRWLFFLVFVSLIVRALAIPDYLPERDSVFFVRGVEDYSVPHLRPHWPGYPVYMWLGKLLNFVLNDVVRSLLFLSASSVALCCFPLFGMVRIWTREAGFTARDACRAGLFAALVWSTVPINWVDGLEPFSDPPALLAATIMFWMSARSLASDCLRPVRWVIAAAVVGALCVGIRLSYGPLLLPLALITLVHWRALSGRWTRPWVFFAAFGTFLLVIGVWFGWQLYMDGIPQYFAAAKKHLAGHYGRWGGTALTDRDPWDRPRKFFWVLSMYGIGGWWKSLAWYRLISTLLWLIFLASGFITLARSPRKKSLLLFLVLFVPYTVWLVYGQAVILPRQHFPLVMFLCMLAGCGYFAARRFFVASGAALVAILIAVSAPIAIEHKEPMLEKQMGYFLKEQLKTARVALLSRSTVPVIKSTALRIKIIPAKPIMAAHQAAPLQQQGYRVFSTGGSLRKKDLDGDAWVPVARFCQSKYMRPFAPYEVMYEFAPGKAPPEIPSCWQPSPSNEPAGQPNRQATRTGKRRRPHANQVSPTPAGGTPDRIEDE